MSFPACGTRLTRAIRPELLQGTQDYTKHQAHATDHVPLIAIYESDSVFISDAGGLEKVGGCAEVHIQEDGHECGWGNYETVSKLVLADQGQADQKEAHSLIEKHSETNDSG